MKYKCLVQKANMVPGCRHWIKWVMGVSIIPVAFPGDASMASTAVLRACNLVCSHHCAFKRKQLLIFFFSFFFHFGFVFFLNCGSRKVLKEWSLEIYFVRGQHFTMRSESPVFSFLVFHRRVGHNCEKISGKWLPFCLRTNYRISQVTVLATQD